MFFSSYKNIQIYPDEANSKSTMKNGNMLECFKQFESKMKRDKEFETI